MTRQTDPLVLGAKRDHPDALAFARVVQRVHHRYASEVVGAFALCPFMSDPETAFGVFCVMLDHEPQLDVARDAVVAAGSRVVHLVYPLTVLPCAAFERFGNALHREVARAHPAPPVHATFHPHMEGDTSRPARLVGVLRRAPDPFVQFVPEGLHQGGTTFAEPAALADLAGLMSSTNHKRERLARLAPADLARIEALLAEIRRERDDQYAPFLASMA